MVASYFVLSLVLLLIFETAKLFFRAEVEFCIFISIV